jgi:hypothetical protein
VAFFYHCQTCREPMKCLLVQRNVPHICSEDWFTALYVEQFRPHCLFVTRSQEPSIRSALWSLQI